MEEYERLKELSEQALRDSRIALNEAERYSTETQDLTRRVHELETASMGDADLTEELAAANQRLDDTRNRTSHYLKQTLELQREFFDSRYKAMQSYEQSQ